MADESGHDENKRCEDDEHAIQAKILHALGDAQGNSVQQARGRDGFPEREPAGSEDDDGPEEIVEVFLRQDAGPKKENHRDDGDDAHVAEDAFELVRDTPEDYCGDGGEADEPLHAGEFVFYGADGDDVRSFRGEGEQEENPD